MWSVHPLSHFLASVLTCSLAIKEIHEKHPTERPSHTPIYTTLLLHINWSKPMEPSEIVFISSFSSPLYILGVYFSDAS
ncbi:MAG: hypothetical protein JOS17DRAFT_755952 [Linnemannia elongata]|nr:MAG: hypothetical protein JOS17DRAFT_755952 [Linnemannia elongata]